MKKKPKKKSKKLATKKTKSKKSRAPAKRSRASRPRVVATPVPTPAEIQDHAIRRRLPRITLTSEQFRLTKTGKIFGVADLSAEGIALRLIDPQDGHLFSVGALIEGTLNLRGDKYPARARVRHLARGIVGMQFEAPTPELKRALSSLLDPETLGRELRPLPASEVAMVWYHGPSGTDLLFRRSVTGQYSQMSLYTLGRYIQWSDEQGIETGFTQVAPPLSGESRQTPEIGLVRFEVLTHVPDVHPDAEKLQIAKTLILSSKLPQDLKQWCTRILRENHGS